MDTEDPFISIVDNILTEGMKHGILRLQATDEKLDGHTVLVDGKHLVNFSSCSYLGLEFDPRLRRGVIDAVERYGTQFSSSRGFISSPQYVELENLFTQIFGGFPVITSTTTLGSIAALPVLIKPKDAFILDIQVHNSVHLASSLCKIKGTASEVIRHNRMDMLEDAIKTFRNRGARSIWYLADGIYSMYGDFAPVDDIISLLNKYDNFYLYIDDAHGFGWMGKNGRGSVLGHRPLHPKMVVIGSLAKAFAAVGGVLVLPNQEWNRKISNCGSTMVFSGPIQPPLLGSLIATCKIMLSDEIDALQQEVLDKIKYTTKLILEYNLPLLSPDITPVRYIGIGLMEVATQLVERVKNDGYFTNLAMFPAVPIKRCGVRLGINRNLTYEEIKGAVDSIHYHLNNILAEQGIEFDFRKTFGDVLPKDEKSQQAIVKKEARESSTSTKLKVVYENTIQNMPKEEWDKNLGYRGTFSWEGMEYMERVFQNNPNPEDNWKFHYYRIYDDKNNLVLMAPFITTICKDDLFSPNSVSEKLEEERKSKNDPYYFCSKTMMMGTLLSEGDHLYLDRNLDWQGALKLLINKLYEEQERDGIETIVLRDFDAKDNVMHDFMLNIGFVKIPLPDTHIFKDIGNDYTHTLNKLSADKRRFVRKEVLSREDLYEVKIFSKATQLPNEEEIENFYKLYQNVADHGFELNVFPFPEHIFSFMMDTDVWEIVALYFKGTDSEPASRLPVAFMSAMINSTMTYSPLIIGLDYKYVLPFGLYRQTLFQLIKRGIALHANDICLGMTASQPKRKLGCETHEIVAYIQVTDTYRLEVLGEMLVERKTLVD